MTALTKLRDRFTEADINDEIVVMRIDNGDFFSLSGTAAAAWRLIDGSRDRKMLIADLSREFEGDPQTIIDDIDAFLGQLRESKLLAG